MADRHCEKCGLDRRTAEYAHELTRTHGLMPSDAIHASTAALARVSVLYTYDAAKKRRRGLLTHNLKIGTPLLRIEKPPNPDKGYMWDPALQPDDDAESPPQS